MLKALTFMYEWTLDTWTKICNWAQNVPILCHQI